MRQSILLSLVLLSSLLKAQQTPAPSTLETPPARLQYLDWGGTGEPLVLIPGESTPATILPSLAPDLLKNFRVISITSPISQPTEVLALLDHLGLQRANLLGHASAAPELIRLTAFHPYRIFRIIALDPLPMQPHENTITKHPILFLTPPDLDRNHRRQLASFRKHGLSVDTVQLTRAQLAQPRRVAKEIIRFAAPAPESRYATPPPFTR